jgi:hypothetical protein
MIEYRWYPLQGVVRVQSQSVFFLV